MHHGAHPAPAPAPRADVALARGCTECRGWGSVITDSGRHELCSACQRTPEDALPGDEDPSGPSRALLRPATQAL